MNATTANSAVEELIVTFNELNPGHVEELHEDPSPLEFMRSVARNTPFVVRGGASGWKATKKWDAAYLEAALTGQSVRVAVTPRGYVSQKEASSWDVKPLTPSPETQIHLPTHPGTTQR